MWFKGIIVEIKDEYSIVIKDDSTVVRVNNKDDMKIGEVAIFLEEDIYEKKETKSKINKKVVCILSAVAALVLLILPMIKSNMLSSYALVSLDVNPSIQLELDKDKNIINIEGMNKDGYNLELHDVKGLSLQEGILKIKETLEKENYKLKYDSAIIGFAFMTEEQDDIYEKEVKDILSKTLKQTKTVYLKGSKQDIEKANEKGISLGRYEAESNIDEELLEDEIENMSVEEILELLRGNKSIYLNEDIIEEINEELEDKLEDKEEEDDTDEDSQENNYSEDNDNEKSDYEDTDDSEGMELDDDDEESSENQYNDDLEEDEELDEIEDDNDNEEDDE